MWQDNGQKLRNVPVKFIKSESSYDPGEFLREQIRLNVQKAAQNSELPAINAIPSIQEMSDSSALPADEILSLSASSDTVPLDHSASLSQLKLPSLQATVESDDEAIDIDDIRPANISRKYGTNVTVRLKKKSEEREGKLKMPVVSDISIAVDDLRLLNREPQFHEKANLDAVLKSLDLHDEFDARRANEAQDIPNSAEDTDENDDAELFCIDVEGDSQISANVDAISDEKICFQPRNTRAASPLIIQRRPTTIEATPWARTIDDPVGIYQPVPQPSKTTGSTHDIVSSKKDRRASWTTSVSERRQDELDIMLDYMNNAQWSDIDSDEESDRASDDPEEEDSTVQQVLGEGSAVELELDVSSLAMVEDNIADDYQTNSESDDTDIDDDLELTIEAEMEEIEFALGYSGSRSHRARERTIREQMNDASLYREDFNVYDSFEGEDSPEVNETPMMSSGRKKHGMNKYINDLDLSVEELEGILISQWKQDRSKKSMKKRERQRLHQEGLIGKKAKRARMSQAKANTGCDELQSINDLIKRFVSSEEYVGIQQLPMAFMDKPIRRAAHMISDIYGLKSNSQGSGKRRHIVLYKTSRCVIPDADFLEETMFRARRSLGFNSKFRDTLPPEPRSSRAVKVGGRAGQGRASQPGARLRDGDLVGADAPEIALANRGRQMLEKLGWLQGSGLGAAGNEGMNIPLFATIKTSKVGLGT